MSVLTDFVASRCAQCVLPATFPGISFDENDLCPYCRRYEGHAASAVVKREYRQKFESLLEEHRGTSSYDVLIAYSGGKDSTYTLDVFVNSYGLRALALTFDNGFISARALDNIRTVCAKLGVDSQVVRPDPGSLARIFRIAAEEELFSRKALERASTICTACIAMVKGITLRTAVEKRIPFVGFGWSPGQAPVQASVMKTNPALTRLAQKPLQQPLRRIAGSFVDAFFVSRAQLDSGEAFPWNVHPLAFLDYDEASIFEKIRTLGWRKPDDTDPNSTNCLLNSYANQVHRDRYGFHPYVWEIASMVRQGVMTREEGVEKIAAPEDPETVRSARTALDAASRFAREPAPHT